MNGMKLNFSIANLAKRNNWGYGSFRLKDGSSVKLVTDPKNYITRLYKVKSGKLYAAEAARGGNKVAAMVDKYAQNALHRDEVDVAIMDSFDVLM